MVFNNNGRTGSRYDEVVFQEMVIGEMGELLPVELIDACDLENARSVLEIGCGAGEWLRGIAQDYPQLQCIGVDQDEGMVMMANAQAEQDGLGQMRCFVSNIHDISPELFPLEKFDLVHLSFLSRYILTVDYPRLARTCVELCRPGGFVCWTEGELPITSSLAFERLIMLLCEALDEAGQSFIPESMWELSALLAKSFGTVAVDRANYKRRHLGITPMPGLWLREAGCSIFNTSSEAARRLFGKYPAIPAKPYAVRLSRGSIPYESFVKVMPQLLHEVKQFLLRKGVIGFGEYDELCAQVERELAAEDFCGLAFVVRVWGKCF
ncbi:MAG TPA: class I SAM-dependent methyltransferase [Ktedonobacteraceae bacterium]|nr:class I SAM-dependent methyltransferase [Ktedonobacteraceae bacterium]